MLDSLAARISRVAVYPQGADCVYAAGICALGEEVLDSLAARISRSAVNPQGADCVYAAGICAPTGELRRVRRGNAGGDK